MGTGARLTPLKVVGTALVIAVVAVMWILFAPTQLGGSTEYTVTSGISMQPLLYKGDLAVVHVQRSYHVGEIVLYESAVLHQPVLHRIMLIQNGNYFFKGDNNDFVDPGYATRAELLGAMWFRIPKVGTLLSWFTTPLHSAVLAAIGGMAIFLNLSSVRRRRRRTSIFTPHRNPHESPESLIMSETTSDSPESPKVATTPSPLTTLASTAATERDASVDTVPLGDQSGIAHPSHHRVPTFHHARGAALGLFATLLAATALCGGLGFTRPTDHVAESANAYRETGTFSYSAVPTIKSDVYPSGKVSTGEPLYPSLIKVATIAFDYHFVTSLANNLTGSIAMRAVVASGSGTWQQAFTLTPPVKFTGDSAFLKQSIALKSLYRLIQGVSTASGISSSNFSVSLEPIVRIKGIIAGHPITSKFSPLLQFSVTPSEIAIANVATQALPGATYVAPSANSQLLDQLNPEVVGSALERQAMTVSVARYAVPVKVLRVISYIVFGLALLALLAYAIVRRRSRPPTNEELIARRLRSVIVPVVTLASADHMAEVDVPGFGDLAELARYLERPILVHYQATQRVYAVDDNFHRYVCTIERDVGAEAMGKVRAAARGHARRIQKATKTPAGKLRTLMRVGTGAIALGTALTLTAVFTASTTVPITYAGARTEVLEVSQLAPTACASLNTTKLVTSTISITNTASHVLILAGTVKQKITDNGGSACIVSGTTNAKIKAPSSDICVTGLDLSTVKPC